MWGAGRGGCSSFCCVVRPFSGNNSEMAGSFLPMDGRIFIACFRFLCF